MVIAFFSIEVKYFKGITIIIYILYFFYFPILVGINSFRPDYISYVEYYNAMPKLFSSNYIYGIIYKLRTEPGFNLLISILKTIFGSISITFIIFCLLSFLFRYQFVKFFSHKADFAIIIFSFLAHEFLRKDAIQIRNGMASAIVLFSFINLFKGQKKKFILWVFIASTFHYAALMALPLTLINTNINCKIINAMRWLLVLLFIGTFFFRIKDILNGFYKIGILPDTVANYLSWQKYSRPMKIYHPVLLKQLMICAFFLFCVKGSLLNKNAMTILLFKIYFISTLYYLFFLDFEILAGRFGSLFAGVETLFLLQFINDGNARNRSTLKLFVFTMIFFIFLANVIIMPSMLSFEPIF
jgi:hypothetical protein